MGCKVCCKLVKCQALIYKPLYTPERPYFRGVRTFYKISPVSLRARIRTLVKLNSVLPNAQSGDQRSPNPYYCEKHLLENVFLSNYFQILELSFS